MFRLKPERSLLLAAAPLALTFGVSQNAGAQATLEEIVVTARRVEESISDAPLAVAVMDTDFLQAQGVENMQDVLELTPGASWNMFTKAQPAFTMRGINAGAFGNSSLETAAGLVQDGVPMTKVFMFVGDVFDMERVEVMRGPQGTSFGRNATLGLVHLVSARPQDEFAGGVNVEAGDLGLGGTNGYITGPLTDGVTGRFSWNLRDWDGSLEDEFTGEALEFSEQRSLRGQLMFEPSDTFSAWVKLEYSDLNEGSTVRTGDLSPTENWLDTRLGAGYLPGNETFVNPDPYKVKQNCPLAGCFVDRQMLFLTAELIWSLDDGISITSLSGYQDGDHETWQDVFGAPVALQDQNVINQAEVFSTELRIDNFASGDSFRWLGGIYLLEDEEFRREENIGNPERPAELGFYNCSGKITSACAGPSHLVNLGDASTSGLGVFGELSFDLTDQLNLTIGGRYSDDSRSYDYAVQGYGNVAGLGSVGLGEPGTADCVNNFVAVDPLDLDPRQGGFTCGTVGTPVGFSQLIERDFDDFSGKVSLSYALNDNNNVYFLYSEGFKAGGFQHDARSRTQLNTGLVDSETARNLEIGWKGSYDAFRFAVTAFQMEQENAHINNLINVSTGFTTFVTNAGGVENTGFELEGTWAATENLTIGGSFASYDPVLVNATQGSALDVNTGVVSGEDISGLVPNYVPDETYTIYFDYQWTLGGGSTIGLRADLKHRGSNWGRAGANDRVTLTQDGTRPMFLRPELDKIGANISWTSADENLMIELWGRNLDDDYDWINFGPGSPFNYAGGVLPPGVTGAPGTARPRGYGGRKQVGVTARFLF